MPSINPNESFSHSAYGKKLSLKTLFLCFPESVSPADFLVPFCECFSLTLHWENLYQCHTQFFFFFYILGNMLQI